MAGGFRAVNEIGGIKIHPAANMFPMMSEEEFRTLKEDLKLRGLEKPIEVDEQGRITDGRNRWKALKELGETSWDDLVKAKQVKVNRKSEKEITAEVWSANFVRRHLTAEQKGAAIRNHQHENNRIEKWEAEAQAEALVRKKNGQTPEKRGARAAKLAREAGISPAMAEKVLEKEKKRGKAYLEETLENVGAPDKRGRGERTHTRHLATVDGYFESITETLSSGQQKKLYKMLGEFLSGESPEAKA